MHWDQACFSACHIRFSQQCRGFLFSLQTQDFTTYDNIEDSYEIALRDLLTNKEIIAEKEAAVYIGMSRSFLSQDRMNSYRKGRTPGPDFMKIGALNYDTAYECQNK